MTRTDSTTPTDTPSAAESATLDLPEVWGLGSFPASDPPANW